VRFSRDFRLFWTAAGTSKLGSGVTSVALPLVAVATLDASTFEVALLSAFTWLPWLIVGLPAGAWVDRLPRRPVMIVCDVLCLGLFVSVPVAWAFDALTMAHLLTVALLAGTATVFFHTAYQVYVPTLLPRESVTDGNSRLQSTEAAAAVVGPGLAGVIAQAAGAVFGLLLDAATFLISALCLWRIRVPERLPARTPVPLRTEIAAGLRFVMRDPYLRVFAVFGGTSNLVLIGYQAVLVVFLIRTVGVGPGLVGLLIAVMSLGAIAGAALAPWVARRFGTAWGTLLCEIVLPPFGLLLPLAAPGPRLWLAVAGGVLLTLGIAAGNVIKGTFRQTYTPHHLLGRVTVSMQLLNFGTIPLGALLGGALGATIGLRPTMWVMMAGVACAGLVLLIGPIRADRNLPAHPLLVADPLGPQEFSTGEPVIHSRR
jgi:MFS family permease